MEKKEDLLISDPSPPINNERSLMVLIKMTTSME